MEAADHTNREPATPLVLEANEATHTANMERIREELADGPHGFVLLRGVFSRDEVSAFRRYCEQVFHNAPCLSYKRIMDRRCSDYQHPILRVSRQQVGKRLFLFPHNHTDDQVARWADRVRRLREPIEFPWRRHDDYRELDARLGEYHLVNQHHEGYEPLHRDYTGPVEQPFLQTVVFLSQHGEEYEEGCLTMHGRDGSRCRVEADLSASAGDLVIFDKRLAHEVEPVVYPTGHSDNRRWTVVMCGRAKYDGKRRQLFKRTFFGPHLYPYILASPRLRALRRRFLGRN